MNSPRLLTLTVRDDTRKLATRLREMADAVKRLRRTKAWKKHITGGVLVYEITYNCAKHTWHPHVHILLDGSFWEQRLIREEWIAQLGQTGGVHIQAVHDRVRTARYIAKYLAKSSDVAAWPSEAIAEFATAMHRQRLIATFGRIHAANVDAAKEEPKPPPLPRYSIPYATLRLAIESGEPAALKAAPILSRLGYAWRLLFIDYADTLDHKHDELLPHELRELGYWMEALDGGGVQLTDAPQTPAAHVLSLF